MLIKHSFIERAPHQIVQPVNGYKSLSKLWSRNFQKPNSGFRTVDFLAKCFSKTAKLSLVHFWRAAEDREPREFMINDFALCRMNFAWQVSFRSRNLLNSQTVLGLKFEYLFGCIESKFKKNDFSFYCWAAIEAMLKQHLSRETFKWTCQISTEIWKVCETFRSKLFWKVFSCFRKRKREIESCVMALR